MLNYNEENLKIVSAVILKNLTPDLLQKKWIERNATNPTFGHCHTASGCLYKLFGSKQVNTFRGFDGEIWHWWVQDKQNKIIDLTADQYFSVNKVPPYEHGEKHGLLGFDYIKRVRKLHEKVVRDLESEGLTFDAE